MGVKEILYDILEYITDQKCHGEDIAVCIIETPYYCTYRIDLRTAGDFTQSYTFKHDDFIHLDTIRKKVDDILNDFRDKYEKAVLKTN